MQTPRRQLRLLTCLVSLAFLLSFPALAQTPAPAPLSPEADAAIKKGIIAAKQQEWLIAIQSFQEARKTAPASPVVFYNLGLAESKIPGRELRAVAWFGAYLTANSNAPNAAAVNDFIDALQIKNQGNINRLITTAQDLASQRGDVRGADYASTAQAGDLSVVVGLWMETGDIAAALKIEDLIEREDLKPWVKERIVDSQIKAGDFAGALRTIDLMGMEGSLVFRKSIGEVKVDEKIKIAQAQVEVGDIAGAQTTLASAQMTADSLNEPEREPWWQRRIVAVRGSIAEAKKREGNDPIRRSTTTAGQLNTISGWLNNLDDESRYGDCALKTRPFLELPEYLTAQHFDDPHKLFYLLIETAEKIIKARNVIDTMLKQQAKK